MNYMPSQFEILQCVNKSACNLTSDHKKTMILIFDLPPFRQLLAHCGSYNKNLR